MAPAKGKSMKGRRASGMNYYDATLATLFHEVAFRLHLQEELEQQAGRAILAFLRGNLVRLQTPELAPTRARIYERTRLKLANAERQQAAVRIQSKFKAHKQREAYKMDLNAASAAAVSVQRHTRGFLARQRYQRKRRERAAVVIQRHQRGHATRARLTRQRNDTEADRRERAAVVIQRRVRGFLTRRWYVRHFDNRACCTCNSLADSEVLICNDCYEVYHLACAGYTAEQRPVATRPWYCHFCVASKAKHTVFVNRKRPDAGAALLRVHATTVEDLQELLRLVTPGGGEKDPRLGKQIPPLQQHTGKLGGQARDRLAESRAKTQLLQGFQKKITSQVATLRAESHSDYIGLPPASLSTTIGTQPIFDSEPAEPLLPGATYRDAPGTASSILSNPSKSSLPPAGPKPSKKHRGSGRKGNRKRPVIPRNRIMDPLHERQPKFPDYVQSREELLKSGTLSRGHVVSVRMSMGAWSGEKTAGLEEVEKTFGLEQVEEGSPDSDLAVPELDALEE